VICLIVASGHRAAPPFATFVSLIHHQPGEQKEGERNARMRGCELFDHCHLLQVFFDDWRLSTLEMSAASANPSDNAVDPGIFLIEAQPRIRVD
jgi:hypothetical protein